MVGLVQTLVYSWVARVELFTVSSKSSNMESRTILSWCGGTVWLPRQLTKKRFKN